MAGRPPTPLATEAAERTLPAWPVYAGFVAFPVWWVVGLAALVWPLLAAVMVGYLMRMERVRVPRGFGLWLLFLLFMLASVTQLDSGLRAVGFGFRAALDLSATVFFVYVYNSNRDALPLRRVAVAVSIFWAFVVFGGYLGVLFPTRGFASVLEHVMPHALVGNSFVHDLVHPHFAEYNANSHVPFSIVAKPRPCAPFPYTNGWGSNYSLSLPFVIVAIQTLRGRPWSRLLMLLIPVSLVPAFLTLNRGMLLALAVGITYAAVRFLFKGMWRPLAGVLLIAIVAGLATLVVPVGSLINQRVTEGQSTETRASVYAQSFDAAKQSPVLGYGSPRPNSTSGQPSLGSQGQIWTLLYAHGFPAATLFVLWMLYGVGRSRQARSSPELWLHVVLVMGFVELWYYGQQISELHLVMLASGLAYREAAEPQTEDQLVEQRASKPAGVAVPA